MPRSVAVQNFSRWTKNENLAWLEVSGTLLDGLEEAGDGSVTTSNTAFVPLPVCVFVREK